MESDEEINILYKITDTNIFNRESDFVLEKVSFVDNENDFYGTRKEYTTNIKAGGIRFDRNQIRYQAKNKSNQEEVFGESEKENNKDDETLKI